MKLLLILGFLLYATIAIGETTPSVVYVDDINYSGIGVASTTWSSSRTYPICTEVSYSGANYIGTKVNTNVTPGNDKTTWYPIPNATRPTQLDCAFYFAASQVTRTHGADLRLGIGTYISGIGMVEPTVTSPGNPIVDIHGAGRTLSIIQQGTNKGDGLAVLYLPPSTVNYAFASFTWEDFTLDANFLATAAMNVYGSQQSTITNLFIRNVSDGSDHYVEIGTPGYKGWVYELTMENIDLSTSHGSGSGAAISTSVSGGVPSFTVTSGGSDYSSTYTQAMLFGTGNFGRACSSPGTTTATIVSGVVTAVTSMATGCVAPVYTMIYGHQNVRYGFKFSNMSDSKSIASLTDGGIGSVAGLYLANIDGAITIDKYHPISTWNGVQDYAGGITFTSLQCDTIFHYCFDSETQGGYTNVINPLFEWNTTTQLGASDYFFGTYTGNPNSNKPVAFNIFGELCQGRAQQTGYLHFATGQGAVDSHVGSGAASLPSYVHAYVPTYCNNLSSAPTLSTPSYVGTNFTLSNGVIGNDWNFNLGTDFGTSNPQVLTLTQANSITGANAGSYTWDFSNPTVATNSQNYKSPILGILGTYYDGAASQPLGVDQKLTFAPGTGPLATYAFQVTGMAPAGGLVYSFDNAIKTTSLNLSGLSASLPVCTDTRKNLTSTCPTFDASGRRNQQASGQWAGTCTMSNATSCTVTMTTAYTGTPICFTSVQGSIAIAGSCSVTSTTVTVTAASSNSQTWGVILARNLK
jgi:hypothetical protein